MLTEDPPNSEIVSTENRNTNVPNNAVSFRRAWNRLSTALSRRQHDVGEDRIERGEHKNQAKDSTHIGEGNHEEDAEAGATPVDRPPTEATKVQQHSPFGSSAFDRLPQPVPVVDVFFGSWWLVTALWTATRPVVIYFSVSWLWTTFFDGLISTILVMIYLFRWALLEAGRETIPLIGAPIPGKRQLFWLLFRWIQKIWEHVIARALLQGDGRYTGLCKIWWFVYLLITPMAEFRQNYTAAWRQREKLSIHIFVDDENTSVPIPKDGTDEAMLARIRSFYQMMLVGQGFPALVFPKQLQRIDFVEMSKDSLVLGGRLGTLQLGRYKGRLVNMFENPKLGAHTDAVAETIRTVPKSSALEFQRTYDVGAISVTVAIPPLASLIFGIVWVQVYAHKSNADLQVIVATAFTVSSYIVTAGALTLALIAFLDQKRAQNDDMIEKIARRSVETEAIASSKLDRRRSVP